MVAVGGLGAQTMPRPLRGLLYGGECVDLDMVGAQPAMIQGVATRKNWPYTAVAAYNAGRDALFAQVAAAKQWSRDQVKQAFTAIFFGRSAESAARRGLLDARNPLELDQAVGALLDELEKLRELVWNDKEYADLKKAVRAAKPEVAGKQMLANIEAQKRSLFALVFQTEERKCLQAVEDELVERGHVLQSYIHDGGLVQKLKGEPLPESVLRSCEEAIERDVGYVVRLSIKPLKSTLAVPDSFKFDDDAEYGAIKTWFESSAEGPRVAMVASESKFVWNKRDQSLAGAQGSIRPWRCLRQPPLRPLPQAFSVAVAA